MTHRLVSALGLEPSRGCAHPALSEKGCSGVKEPLRAWIRLVLTLLGYYCAGLLSAPKMLLSWPETRNGPEVRCCLNSNAGIFFLSPLLCFQPEIPLMGWY